MKNGSVIIRYKTNQSRQEKSDKSDKVGLPFLKIDSKKFVVGKGITDKRRFCNFVEIPRNLLKKSLFWSILNYFKLNNTIFGYFVDTEFQEIARKSPVKL